MENKKKECKNCAYFYKTVGTESVTYYNALLERYLTEYPQELKSACGYSPGGVFLDDDQRFCANYEEA